MTTPKPPRKRATAKPGTIPAASGIPVHCAHTKLAALTSLNPNPRNPNKHGKRQINLLAKVIKHQGWRSSIIVSNRSGFIVAGHGRYMAAKTLGVSEVPVDFQDFASDEEETAHLLADNQLAELAEIDEAELASLLAELDGKIDLDLTGFDTKALEEFNPGSLEAERLNEQFMIVITCESELQQLKLLDRFTIEGFQCKALIS